VAESVRGMSWTRLFVVIGLPLAIIALGVYLWWPPCLGPPCLEPDRRSDLGATVVGGGIVALVVLYLDQVLSLRQERNILRLQLSSGSHFERIDLRNQDLSGFYLPSKDFKEADLRGADLRRTTLSGSSFIRTRLYGADLRGADLGPIPGITGDAWLGVTKLEGVLYDSSTRWPEGSGDARWPEGVDPKERGAINLDEQSRGRRIWQWIKDRGADIFG
jgi:Pentapeptide repeats (8 copies)